uniref:Uncharacterized protein n=1 Tax=Parastrongyloides trichosuri TaxID=131310 RepID=A0A0N4ZJ73_PARTI
MAGTTLFFKIFFLVFLFSSVDCLRGALMRNGRAFNLYERSGQGIRPKRLIPFQRTSNTIGRIRNSGNLENFNALYEGISPQDEMIQLY